VPPSAARRHSACFAEPSQPLERAETRDEERAGEPTERVREAGCVEELHLQRVDELVRRESDLEGTSQERSERSERQHAAG
jgi:hypothetical protein